MKIPQAIENAFDPRSIRSLGKEGSIGAMERGIPSKKAQRTTPGVQPVLFFSTPGNPPQRSRSRGPSTTPLEGKGKLRSQAAFFRSPGKRQRGKAKGLEEIVLLFPYSRAWGGGGRGPKWYKDPNPREGLHHFQEINGGREETPPNFPPFLVHRRRSRGGVLFSGRISMEEKKRFEETRKGKRASTESPSKKVGSLSTPRSPTPSRLWSRVTPSTSNSFLFPPLWTSGETNPAYQKGVPHEKPQRHNEGPQRGWR
ncbi:hypothetical protein GWK47_007299 [Chionoecetes opilio]|uniref:Uncharacterized protein n=1 Tax=Chionoecetes opilio TaxID=41210 RepID=A0A8J5CSS4_CHIOP|nr:hypothetical protein GWK47_007299 [Chionoecetes opilio]